MKSLYWALIYGFSIIISGQAYAQNDTNIYLCPKQLSFLFPESDGVVSSADTLLLQAEYDDDLSFGHSPLAARFTLSPVGIDTAIVLAEGNLRSFRDSASNRMVTSLPLADVPSSSYLIVAEVSAGSCPLLKTQVMITVNRAPEVQRIDVVSCSDSVLGREVRFRAVISDAENDPVTQLLWNGGDEQDSEWVIGSNEWTHRYTPGSLLAGPFPLRLIAYDDYGGKTTSVEFSLDTCTVSNSAVVKSSTPMPADHCVAEALIINSQSGANTEPYCRAQQLPLLLGCREVANATLPPAKRCPQGTIPTVCQLGSVAPYDADVGELDTLRWRFEAVAKLRGNPQQCQMAQLARGTEALDVVVPNPMDPAQPRRVMEESAHPNSQAAPTQTFSHLSEWGLHVAAMYPGFAPANPDSFGADGTDLIWPTLFGGALPFRKRIDNIWTFVDTPGISLARPVTRLLGFTQAQEFVTYAVGNTGIADTAWCRFRIQQRLNGEIRRRTNWEGGFPAPNRVIPVGGWNCQIEGYNLEPFPLNRWLRTAQGMATSLQSDPLSFVGGTHTITGYRLGLNKVSRPDNVILRYQAIVRTMTGFTALPIVDEATLAGDPPNQAGGPRQLVGFNAGLFGTASNNFRLYYKGTHQDMIGERLSPTCVNYAGPTGNACGIARHRVPIDQHYGELTKIATWLERRTAHVNLAIDVRAEGFGLQGTEGPIHWVLAQPGFAAESLLVDFATPIPNLGLAYSGINAQACQLIERNLGQRLSATDVILPGGVCDSQSTDLRALRFRLTGTEANNYDVYYEVAGGPDRRPRWSVTCKNNEFCRVPATASSGITALQLWVVRKN